MRSISKNNLLEQLDHLPEQRLLSTFFEVLGKGDIELATDMLHSLSKDKRNYALDAFERYNLKSYAEAEYLLWQAIELLTQNIFFCVKNVIGNGIWIKEVDENTIKELKAMQENWLGLMDQVKAPNSPSLEHPHAQQIIDTSKKVFELMKVESATGVANNIEI